jgi:hypothetical protein
MRVEQLPSTHIRSYTMTKTNSDTLPLDPTPWAHHYFPTDRAETNDLPGNLRDFKPREGYEQDRMNYTMGQRW